MAERIKVKKVFRIPHACRHRRSTSCQVSRPMANAFAMVNSITSFVTPTGMEGSGFKVQQVLNLNQIPPLGYASVRDDNG